MNDKVFDLLEKMYGELVEFKKDTSIRFEKMENKLTVMENDNKKHFDALYDGYKQSIELIKEVKEEVSKHDEIIFKRIK